jgi:hypothetical protein
MPQKSMRRISMRRVVDACTVWDITGDGGGTGIMQSRSARSFIHVLSALLLLSHAPAFSQSAKSNAAQAAGLSMLVLGSGGPGATGRAERPHSIKRGPRRSCVERPARAAAEHPATPTRGLLP